MNKPWLKLMLAAVLAAAALPALADPDDGGIADRVQRAVDQAQARAEAAQERAQARAEAAQALLAFGSSQK